MESVYSKRIRAGKRRTYFFDVRETRGNDYYLPSQKAASDLTQMVTTGTRYFYTKKILTNLSKGLGEAVDYVKTELMPDFDFDAFNHDTPYEGEDGQQQRASVADLAVEKPVEITEEVPAAVENLSQPDNGSTEEVDKW